MEHKLIELILKQAAVIEVLSQILHEQAAQLTRGTLDLAALEADMDGLANLLDKMEVDFSRLE